MFGGRFDSEILGDLYPDDFFKPSNIGSVVVSPSGDSFIHTYSKVGAHYFNVIDAETWETRTYVGTDSGNDFVNFVDWKDENQIIFQTRFGNVYSLNLKTKKRVEVFDSGSVVLFWNAIFWGNFRRPQVVSLLPNDPEHILISSLSSGWEREVYKVNINTSKKKKVQKKVSGVVSWFADWDGNVRLGFKSTKNGFGFLLKSHESGRWKSLDSIRLGDQEISSVGNKETIIDRRDYFVSFSGDNEKIYIGSNRFTDTISIYRVDLVSGEFEQVAHDPRYDFVKFLDGSSQVALSRKKRDLVGVAIEREGPEMIWLDDEYAKIVSKIDEHLPDTRNFITSMNLNEDVFSIMSLCSNSPTSYHYYSLKDDRLKKIGSANTYLENTEMPEVQPISFEARDGLLIDGYLTKPLGTDGAVSPLIVLVHGGPWVRDEGYFNPIVQWLAYKKYSVLQVNYRGSTGFGYEHFIAASKDYGWSIQKDIEDAVSWAVDEGHAEQGRVGIMGSSYGGYAAALAVSTNPDLFECAVATSGIYDLLMETKSIKNTHSDMTYASWRKLVGDLAKDKEALKLISPVNHIDSNTKPIFVVHGDEDEVAAIEHAELLVEKLEEVGVEHDYLPIKGEGHGFMYPKNQAIVYGEIVEFLNVHLPVYEN